MLDLFENHIVGFPMRRLSSRHYSNCAKQAAFKCGSKLGHFILQYMENSVVFHYIF